jgi:asparagine synthase (glutamine-hydrolysing)
MCGIVALINCGDQDILKRMAASVAHRGPDDEGIEWFPDSRSGLGHRRLSILDLSPAGHQPMTDESGRFWIVLNGEVYNFAEIRKELEKLGHRFRSKTDTEVLLEAYRHLGGECLGKLNGMFAFTIYDSQTREVFAARDRLGVKPLYYAEVNGGLILASEIKAILSTSLVEKRPDYFALHTPTRFQISPYTGFEGIRKLPPGHSLRYRNGKLTISKYWDITPSESYGGTEAQAVDALDTLLRDAVRLQMIADVPVGVFLSGGLDSSIVTALMRENTTADIHAFTIRFADEDQRFEKIVDDSVYARKVAKQFGLKYHEIEIHPDVSDLLQKMVWHLDEPLADPAAINTYLIAKAAREQGIIVLLNGMGGDEIFGGYRKQLACLKADVYQSMVPRLVRSAFESVVESLPVASSSQGFKLLRWSKRFLSFASLPPAERYMMSDLSLSEDQYAEYFGNGVAYRDSHFFVSEKAAFAQNGISYLTQMCLNDTRFFLPDHNLTYSDKASMAVAIEGRPPLTDHRIAELMFTMPPQFRIQRNVQKYLLKKVAECYLPYEIAYRPKAPFGAPLRSWIRGPLAPMIDDLLSEQSLKKRGLYNPSFVARLIESDRNGREDNAQLIWMLLTNEVWFRTFFDS